jgi:hypothetical protein
VDFSGETYRGNRHWFDEECMGSKMASKEALKDFEEKNDEASRIKQKVQRGVKELYRIRKLNASEGSTAH